MAPYSRVSQLVNSVNKKLIAAFVYTNKLCIYRYKTKNLCVQVSLLIRIDVPTESIAINQVAIENCYSAVFQRQMVIISLKEKGFTFVSTI